MSFRLKILPLLRHTNEDISHEALALIKALLYAGNSKVQDGLEYLRHTRDESFFEILKKRVTDATIKLRERYVFHVPC